MRIYIKTALIASLVFVACSDMSVDSENIAMAPTNSDPHAQITYDVFSVPADFDLKVYLEINPDIKSNQIIQAVRARNAAFIDSMAMLQDSVTLEDGTVTSIGAYAKTRYKADTAAFVHDDTAFTHKVFLLAGYNEEDWISADSLNKEQRLMICRFNLIQSGEPSIKEDKEFIEKFVYDESLMELHYAVYGGLDGRAYRYCKSTELGTLKSEIVPDTMGVSPRIMDYNAHLFCLNKEDGLVYSIK